MCLEIFFTALIHPNPHHHGLILLLADITMPPGLNIADNFINFVNPYYAKIISPQGRHTKGLAIHLFNLASVKFKRG